MDPTHVCEPKLNPNCNMCFTCNMQHLLLLLPGGGYYYWPISSPDQQQQLQRHLKPDRPPQRPPCLLQPSQRVSNLGQKHGNLP